MIPIMSLIANTFSCNLNTFNKQHLKEVLKNDPIDVLSIYISSINTVELLVKYFRTFPFLGIK